MKNLKSKNIEKGNIEETFKKLDELIKKLESDKCGLEDSIKYYEMGAKLVKDAKKIIDRVEKKLEVIDNGIE